VGGTMSKVKIQHTYETVDEGISTKITYNHFSVDIDLKKYGKNAVICPFCHDELELTVYPPISLRNSVELSLHSEADKDDLIHPRNLFIAGVIVLPIWILLFQWNILFPGWLFWILAIVSLFLFSYPTSSIYYDMRTVIVKKDSSNWILRHIVSDYLFTPTNEVERRIPYYK
jgi:hypothetical protein